jgi:hypothetical protein
METDDTTTVSQRSIEDLYSDLSNIEDELKSMAHMIKSMQFTVTYAAQLTLRMLKDDSEEEETLTSE